MANFISVAAVTEAVAQERIKAETGYEESAVGALLYVGDEDDSSRQRPFVYKTFKDVTQHALYSDAKLSDTLDIGHIFRTDAIEDGPVLILGREVTVGG